MNAAIAASPIDTARALYEGEGLALPPVSAALIPRLRRIGAATYATRDLDWTLYDFHHFLRELQSGKAVEPYVAFGLAGHGLTSQAAHYYAVSDYCAVLFQLRWGTPMNQPERDRALHDAALSLAGKLDVAAQKLAQSGKAPAGRRIVAAESSFHGSRWTWLPASGGGEPQWRPGRGGVVVNALAELVNLI